MSNYTVSIHRNLAEEVDNLLCTLFTQETIEEKYGEREATFKELLNRVPEEDLENIFKAVCEAYAPVDAYYNDDCNLPPGTESLP